MIRMCNNHASARLAGVTDGIHDDRPGEAAADQALRFAREIYTERRRRDRFFPLDLFGEPSWDILLDLFIASREERRVPTTSACIGAHVPPTTALRWLRILEARGLVEREGDRRDGRRTFVQLSSAGIALMEDFVLSTRAALLQCTLHENDADNGRPDGTGNGHFGNGSAVNGG